jgi:hypothetical protein
MVRAEILVRPNGEAHVRLEPAAANAEQLRQLILCYGAKLRWLLKDEPEWVRQALESLSWEAVLRWEDGFDGPALESLPSAAALRAMAVQSVPEVPRHERYIIQLYSDEHGRGYPCGTLPSNPLRANLVRHFIALLQTVAARLNGGERAATQPVLLDWWDAMFGHSSQLGEDASLNEHIGVANRIHAQASAAARAGRDGRPVRALSGAD